MQKYNLNQQCGDATHHVIASECEKYPSTTTLKPATILAKVIKWNDVHFFKMTPNNEIPVLNYTYKKLLYHK